MKLITMLLTLIALAVTAIGSAIPAVMETTDITAERADGPARGTESEIIARGLADNPHCYNMTTSVPNTALLNFVNQFCMAHQGETIRKGAASPSNVYNVGGSTAGQVRVDIQWFCEPTVLTWDNCGGPFGKIGQCDLLNGFNTYGGQYVTNCGLYIFQTGNNLLYKREEIDGWVYPAGFENAAKIKADFVSSRETRQSAALNSFDLPPRIRCCTADLPIGCIDCPLDNDNNERALEIIDRSSELMPRQGGSSNCINKADPICGKAFYTCTYGGGGALNKDIEKAVETYCADNIMLVSAFTWLNKTSDLPDKRPLFLGLDNYYHGGYFNDINDCRWAFYGIVKQCSTDGSGTTGGYLWIPSASQTWAIGVDNNLPSQFCGGYCQ